MRPNVILILADDMGFADIGCLGSEIRTPNLDAMARNGTLLSAMYNCARCCPTRASLLTGLYPHRAGIGHMGANLGGAAYQGYLRDDCATIAEVLRHGGYRTLMSGKWHVGGDYADVRERDIWQPGDPTHPTPLQRGFERFYGMVDGAGSFFEPHFLMEDDSRIEITTDRYHFTDAVSDKACRMITESTTVREPFFLYLAYTAPHWPLHAWPEDIAAYDGVYNKGWDVIRCSRHEEMLGLEILQKPWDISPRDPQAPPWESRESRDWEAQRMAVYAAMVTQMDRGIGRVLDTLRAQGQEDNTLILFLSDNGGCAEFMAEDGWAQTYPTQLNDGRPAILGNRPGLRPGGAETFMSYDLPWANVSNAPFRLFKHWVHEGGISTPLIAQWPSRLGGPRIAHAPCHVVDILPTILAATGVPYPGEIGGHALQPLDGEPLLDLLAGKDWARQQPILWEHEGNAAVRLGPWKLVRRHGCDWELYNMEEDRTELSDMRGRHQKLEDELIARHGAWCDEIGVRDWAELEQVFLTYYNMTSQH
jgi:arylsulfatase